MMIMKAYLDLRIQEELWNTSNSSNIETEIECNVNRCLDSMSKFLIQEPSFIDDLA